ncbi:MAG: hypothetical protein ACM3JG_07670 [Thiohalocapsa sp.]
MTDLFSWIKWVLAVTLIMASPIVLVLVVPAIIGLAFDVADLASEKTLVLGLSGALGLSLLGPVARRVPLRRSAPHHA